MLRVMHFATRTANGYVMRSRYFELLDKFEIFQMSSEYISADTQ
jgi:hypothetical protein